MKKLILLLLISSCGYAPIDRTRGIIITDIENNEGIMLEINKNSILNSYDLNNII